MIDSPAMYIFTMIGYNNVVKHDLCRFSVPFTYLNV